MTPHRREFLRAGAAAGLTLAAGSRSAATPAPAGRAKSCIVLMLTGGPSQLDTWDPKPDAPGNVRSPFASIRTRVPGVAFTELFPKMAAMADKFSLVRTLHHDYAPIHENGFQLLNTGRRFGDGPEWPSVGAVFAHLTADRRSNFPVAIRPKGLVDTGVNVSHGQGAAYLGAEIGPLMTGSYVHPGGEMIPMIIDASRRHYSGRMFITANTYETVFDAVSWDCHADGGSLFTDLGVYRDTVAPNFDMDFTTLVTNLDQRGLLDETLVVAVGEFGRTPKRNANGGRDHWPGCWTAIVAGGGVQGGRVIGRSDAIGGEPADRPVSCPELVATIYHALGIPPTTPIPGPDGSPAPAVEAEPVWELF